jgi:hypothetical protein
MFFNSLRYLLSFFFLLTVAFGTESEKKFPAGTLILDHSAPEKRFFGGAGVGPVAWNPGMKCINLGSQAAVEFYLSTIPEGRYIVAVHCRTGHQETGWEYTNPTVQYKVDVNGTDIPMIRSSAKPEMRLKGTGWYDYSGWIVSENFVHLKPGNRVKVRIDQSYTYLLEIAFLAPQQAFGAEWLVPDMMGKTFDTVNQARGQLIQFGEKVTKQELILAGYAKTWLLKVYKPAIFETFTGDKLNSELWTTYTNNPKGAEFIVKDHSVQVGMKTDAGYQDAQVYSRKAFNIFEKKTEFTFSQTMSQSYASTRNYITTSTGYPGRGFAVYYQRFTDSGGWKSCVKLVELDKKGQTAATLYDSGLVLGFGSGSFSLVLDGNRWEFSWTPGVEGTRTVQAKGKHGIKQEEIGEGLHMGFGLNNDAFKGGPFYSIIYHAAVVRADEAQKMQIPNFKSVTAEYERAYEGYKKRVEAIRKEFEEAKKTNNGTAIDRLQRINDQLRKEADQSLEWVRESSEQWIKDVLQFTGTIPAIPQTKDYHARWAGILREWIEVYKKDLKQAPKISSHKEISRRMARASRMMDLCAREAVEIAAAKPAKEALPLQPPAVNNVDRDQSAHVCINGVWDFASGNDAAGPPVKWEGNIRVPHGPWRETFGGIFTAPKGWDTNHHVGWYRTKFFIPADWKQDGVDVRFEAVMYYTEVYVNDIYCGNHLGGFDRFNIDISKAVRPGQANEMQVMVKDSYDTMVEPGKCQPNYICVNDLWNVSFGGIWEDVYLEYRPGQDVARIADVAISTPVINGVKLNLKGYAENRSKAGRSLKLRFSVIDGKKTIATLETQSKEVAGGAWVEWNLSQAMPGVKLWGIGGKYGEPYLYRLKTELLDGEKVIDTRFDPFGFSQVWIRGDKFYLNGKPIFLAGGGVWYLQEGKWPNGNRFYFDQLMKWERLANINIDRHHRQGDVTQQIYAESAEMGMLMEQEVNPGANTTSPVDMTGVQDFADPVWVANTARYYQQYGAKHRNYPCIGLSSVENETFSYGNDEELMQRTLSFAREAQAEDPLRIYDFHGNHQMADHPGPKFINLHYVQSGEFPVFRQKAKGRPIINGEHNSGGTPLMNNQDRKVAAQGEMNLANFWRQQIKEYLTGGTAGLYVFVPAFQLFCTTRDWTLSTPWGDRFKDLSKFSPGDDRWTCNFSASVDIPWPSLSGPDTKAERLNAHPTNSTINWFDPSRPAVVLTKVFDALKESFPKMPPCNIQRCQEALITVTAKGKPLPGAIVILTPADSQPLISLGAVTDPNGTAWIVPRIPGPYNVVVLSPDGSKTEGQILLGRYKINKPGYEEVLVRKTIEMNETVKK